MRGRKPQAISTRKPQPVQAVVTDVALPMPDVVALVPDARECWDIISSAGFADTDVVMVTEFCMAFAANRQAWRDMYDEQTGELVLTQVAATTGDLKKSASWSIWRESVDILRHLSGVLGLDPLTKERLNLTKATTSSIAADIPAKVAKAVRSMNG